MNPLEQIARQVAAAIDEDLKDHRGAYTAIGGRLVGGNGTGVNKKLTQHLRDRDDPGVGSRNLNVMDLLALADYFDKKPGEYLDEYVDRVTSRSGAPMNETLRPEQTSLNPGHDSASGELAELLRQLDALRLPLSRHGILVDWKTQS